MTIDASTWPLGAGQPSPPTPPAPADGATPARPAVDDKRTESVTLTRAAAQAKWYDRHANRARRWYSGIKLAQVTLGALVPAAAASQAGRDGSPYLTGGLGVLIVVLEGVQQLFQFHGNWLLYRQTCVDLVTQRQLYLSGAGDYSTATAPVQLLATRVEAIIARELTTWMKAGSGGAAPSADG